MGRKAGVAVCIAACLSLLLAAFALLSVPVSSVSAVTRTDPGGSCVDPNSAAGTAWLRYLSSPADVAYAPPVSAPIRPPAVVSAVRTGPEALYLLGGRMPAGTVPAVSPLPAPSPAAGSCNVAGRDQGQTAAGTSSSRSDAKGGQGQPAAASPTSERDWRVNLWAGSIADTAVPVTALPDANAARLGQTQDTWRWGVRGQQPPTVVDASRFPVGGHIQVVLKPMQVPQGGHIQIGVVRSRRFVPRGTDQATLLVPSGTSEVFYVRPSLPGIYRLRASYRLHVQSGDEHAGSLDLVYAVGNEAINAALAKVSGQSDKPRLDVTRRVAPPATVDVCNESNGAQPTVRSTGTGQSGASGTSGGLVPGAQPGVRPIESGQSGGVQPGVRPIESGQSGGVQPGARPIESGQSAGTPSEGAATSGAHASGNPRQPRTNASPGVTDIADGVAAAGTSSHATAQVPNRDRKDLTVVQLGPGQGFYPSGQRPWNFGTPGRDYYAEPPLPGFLPGPAVPFPRRVLPIPNVPPSPSTPPAPSQQVAPLPSRTVPTPNGNDRLATEIPQNAQSKPISSAPLSWWHTWVPRLLVGVGALSALAAVCIFIWLIVGIVRGDARRK